MRASLRLVLGREKIAPVGLGVERSSAAQMQAVQNANTHATIGARAHDAPREKSLFVKLISCVEGQ